MKEKTDINPKFKLLDDTIANIEKEYGKGTIMRLGDKPIQKLEVISTGCLSLDYALGVGGVPKGRIIEVYGPESSGKTTICLHVIAEAQKKGGIAAFIDVEHALDLNYAKKLGVDTTNLLLSQPDFGEQALEIVDNLVRSNAVDVIVVDSVAALVPRSEIEGDMGDPQMGMQARLMSQALRKLTAAVAKSKTCIIFTNQLRSKIGIMFGNPETTSGGNALKFYATIRLDIRRMSAMKNGTDVYGNRTKVKVVKNKVAPPFKEVEIDIIFGKGINAIGDVIDLGLQFDVLKKAGAWYTLGTDRFQGKEQVAAYLEKDSTAFNSLKLKIEEVLADKQVLVISKNDVLEKNENPD